MEMEGAYTIPADRETVWNGLNDENILRQAIPGCEEITKISDTELEAVVSAKVGPVKAKFRGQVTLSDLDPPNGYTISGEGKGGGAGFAKGGAAVRLEEVPEGTQLTYDVTASVGGKLAQIGGRLIDSTAKKMAEDFFTRFSDLITESAQPATSAAPEPPPEPMPTPAPPPGSTPPPGGPAPAADPLADHKPISFTVWAGMMAALLGAGVLLGLIALL